MEQGTCLSIGGETQDHEGVPSPCQGARVCKAEGREENQRQKSRDEHRSKTRAKEVTVLASAHHEPKRPRHYKLLVNCLPTAVMK